MTFLSMTPILMAAVNLLVGLCVGLTGIAGFLLPMFYSGFLGFPSAVSLALSFSAFLVSGILGSAGYYRSGNLDLRTGLALSLGSFPGAILGVRLNLLIPEAVIKSLLYLVVLGSGLSILVRELRSSRKKETAGGSPQKKIMFYVILGLITGAACAASGAGGPVLVMPLLTICGFPAHMAVGIALFDSIFIALPAAWGYLQAAFALSAQAAPAIQTSAAAASLPPADALRFLPVLLLFHGAGVLAGSRFAVRINQKLLKTIVATASIIIACLKLSGF